MAERIELPKMALSGSAQKQLEEMYSYLYRTAQTLNVNLSQIGNGALTDEESALMNQLTMAVDSANRSENPVQPTYNYAEAETLKSLIIKTAQFVKNEVDNYRLVLFGEESAEGQYGNWNRKKGLRVDVTPDGIKQTYSYAEIVKGLKTFEINAKNYIKTGYLRTENSIPIYGVAIGRDVVTFSEDGTETYNDGNKVAELTADALSFYQNGSMVAKYAGTKTSFYAGGTEVFYIESGKIYSTVDLELGSAQNVKIGNWKFNTGGLTYYNNDSPQLQFGNWANRDNDVTTGVYVEDENSVQAIRFRVNKYGYNGQMVLENDAGGNMVFRQDLAEGTAGYLGTEDWQWWHGYIFLCHTDILYYRTQVQTSSRDIKHDIQDMEDPGEKLDRLRPVTFVYDDDQKEQKRCGLIYEETLPVMPEICTGDEAEKGINYVEMIPMLLKEVQNLRQRVSELERR